jgi:hypothetical protein
MPFLTSEQTGGPRIFRQNHSEYLAIQGDHVRIFHVAHLAAALDAQRQAGVTAQEHASLILLACCKGRLFEWLDKIGVEGR